MIRKGVAFVIAVLVLSTLACGLNINLPIQQIETGPTVTDDINVPPPASTAGTANVEIRFGGGELSLNPGAQNALVSGTATYNVADFKPEVTVNGNRVLISQDDFELQGIPDFGDRIQNEWNLAFGAVPMDLTIAAGAYQGEMELGGLVLEDLHITDGAAENTVSFSEPNQAEMQMLRYETGASKVTLTGLGNANFGEMQFQSGAGDYTLEFTGELSRDATVEIKSGVSNVTIIVPQGIQANLSLEGGLTNVDDNGAWQGSGGEYSLAGDGPTLTFIVEMGAGNIQLQN
jgi:hypothetical protein